MWKDIQTLPPDGRQSETALMIARGVRRLLRARGFSSLTELALTDGRRADIAAVNRDGEVWIVEVKSSPADFRADRKWRDYAACCDQLYFAISEHTPIDLMPLEAGLIVADPYGAEKMRLSDRRKGVDFAQLKAGWWLMLGDLEATTHVAEEVTALSEHPPGRIRQPHAASEQLEHLPVNYPQKERAASRQPFANISKKEAIRSPTPDPSCSGGTRRSRVQRIQGSS
jgi:hypothetical protein